MHMEILGKSPHGWTMPGFIRDGKRIVEIVLCDSVLTALILQGPVPWDDKDDKEGFRCMAPDPSIFPRRPATGKSDVHMKLINQDLLDQRIVLNGSREGFLTTANADRITLEGTAGRGRAGEYI